MSFPGDVPTGRSDSLTTEFEEKKEKKNKSFGEESKCVETI